MKEAKVMQLKDKTPLNMTVGAAAATQASKRRVSKNNTSAFSHKGSEGGAVQITGQNIV